ncbi:HEXXH motif-containing putative peptide modification protein [Lentzea sp. BCCO 10_0798]|uniref:HEXXH motif-containing putative peptide modification protein n=1 Tax=Lentzea kristufekii TaxID=3095430 RepID=A0ABU4TWI2_9PSEU|nr:HEXXH motif-containing putative peptide modification protein [Lentzea sp. BCCO 10_0798]MDX8052577.1 HEXXH motif-containing putative peptide modification protein [Lentzea sp. BCCO 10_0798]
MVKRRLRAAGYVNTGSSMLGSPSAPALHARLAPADVLVDERRALYRLAVELFAPGTEISDNLLDHPIVRYELGRALAGHGGVDPDALREVAAMGVRDAGIAVASDPAAAEQLEAPLRIIAPPGQAPRPLTEADGERFETAMKIVAEGVDLFRRLAPAMADDLLAHVPMLAVLKTETSGGVVSASSRYVPGIVLIDEPVGPMEVAEALVHEGAHEKFFDFAITREFLDAHAEDAEYFENSWSKARWPLEQTFAAWHAYTCLSQFFLLSESEQLGPHSLLPKARERAGEIGDWLLAHEHDLLPDARWLLHALAGRVAGAAEGVSTADVSLLATGIREDGNFRVLPDVAYRRAKSGRAVVGRLGERPEIFWLDPDAGWVLNECCRAPAPFGTLLGNAAEHWRTGVPEARRRLTAALGSLHVFSIIEASD